jgi:hypothetical protein
MAGQCEEKAEVVPTHACILAQPMGVSLCIYAERFCKVLSVDSESAPKLLGDQAIPNRTSRPEFNHLDPFE